MKLYVVSGGIGKHVMFTSLIDKLTNGYEDKISVMSAYPDVFKFHPSVKHSVDFEQPGFYDEFVVNEETEVINSEPYYSNYVKGGTHLIYEWGKQLGLEMEENVSTHGGPTTPKYKTEIWIDDFTAKEAKKFKEEQGNFIITQFSGGQSPLGNHDQPFKSVGQVRDYPREEAQELVNQIKDEYPNITILNYGLPNESTANLDSTISITAPYLFYVALLQLSEGYICIDSSLQHFAANKFNMKSGIVLWGSTAPWNLGYKKNKNIFEPSANLDIRPLTRAMGDVYNKDKTVWQSTPIEFTSADDLMEYVEEMLIENDKQEDSLNNVVVDEERKKNIIELDTTTMQLIMALNAQAKGLNTQIEDIIRGVIEQKGYDGQYQLSQDSKALIKTG